MRPGSNYPKKGKGLQTECNLALYARRYDLQKEAGINLIAQRYRHYKSAGEAEAIAKDMHYDMEKTYLNTFRASIYENLGQKSLAEQYYRNAISSSSVLTTNYDILYAKIKYASFLMSEQKELLSEDQQREFALLDLRYKVSEEKRKNAIQTLDLMKRKQYDVLIGAVIFLLLAGCIISIIYYKKRMASLRAIVSNHLENAESVRRLKEHYEKLLAERNNEKTTDLTDDKASELFSRLEKLMIDEHIYRQCDLSLEKTAKLLNTNRTYLSQVINEYAESFTAYVNQFRLKEAIEILSDPDSTDSLKTIGLSVGFASPSNFYTLFRNKVGMAPSVFRENARVTQTGQNSLTIEWDPVTTGANGGLFNPATVVYSVMRSDRTYAATKISETSVTDTPELPAQGQAAESYTVYAYPDSQSYYSASTKSEEIILGDPYRGEMAESFDNGESTTSIWSFGPAGASYSAWSPSNRSFKVMVR